MPLGASRAGLMSVAADDIPDSVVSRPDDNDTTNRSDSRGLRINPNASYEAVGVRISANTSGVSRARLYDYNASEYIETVDVSDLSSGDTFSFDSSIYEGVDYGIELDDNGDSWTMGFADGAQDYPYTGDDIDIVGNSIDGTKDVVNAQAVNDIGNPDGILD